MLVDATEKAKFGDSYLFSPTDPDSPLLPDVVPANESTVYSCADNPTAHSTVRLTSALPVEITASMTQIVTLHPSVPPASNQSIRTETSPSQWHTRVLHACANFLGMIAVAIAGTVNLTFLSGNQSCGAGDSPSVLSCSPRDVRSLNQFFRNDERGVLAPNCPAYEEIPDRPKLSFTLETALTSIICHDLSADR